VYSWHAASGEQRTKRRGTRTRAFLLSGLFSLFKCFLGRAQRRVWDTWGVGVCVYQGGARALEAGAVDGEHGAAPGVALGRVQPGYLRRARRGVLLAEAHLNVTHTGTLLSKKHTQTCASPPVWARARPTMRRICTHTHPSTPMTAASPPACSAAPP
jgi:hypothetical protein